MERNFQCLYDDATIKCRTIHPRAKSWFIGQIWIIIRKRGIAYSGWKRFRTPQLKAEFRAAKRRVNDSIRIAKTEYYSRCFVSTIGVRHTGKRVREIGVGRPNSVFDRQFDADEFNGAFLHIPVLPIGGSYYNFSDLNLDYIDADDNIFLCSNLRFFFVSI